MKYLNPFLPKETLLDATILLISIFSVEVDLYVGEIFVFRFQYHQILYFFPFLYMFSKLLIYFFNL